MRILSTQRTSGSQRPRVDGGDSNPGQSHGTKIDGDALLVSSFIGALGVSPGAQVGTGIGALYGRKIAAALTGGGATNPDFFPNLAIGTRIGGLVGGAVLAAVGFAAVTGATYAILKLGEPSTPPTQA